MLIIANNEFNFFFHLKAQMLPAWLCELAHLALVPGYRNCLKAALPLFSVNTDITAEINCCQILPQQKLHMLYHQFTTKLFRLLHKDTNPFPLFLIPFVS